MISEMFVALFAVLLGVEIYIGINRMNELHEECEKNIKQVEKLSSKLESLASENNENKLSGIREGTKTNGGWSGWSVWTDCSATCNTGVQTRQRQCNNPVPSSGGQYCEGSSMDVVHCNNQHCPRAKSSFTAKDADRLSTGILSFPNVRLNEGSNFNGRSGTFTCQLSGLYFFTASVVESGSGENSVLCYIRQNDNDQVWLRYRNGKDSTDTRTSNGYGAATGSATLHLTNGDRVHVWCDKDTKSVVWSSFTGFLIAEDP